MSDEFLTDQSSSRRIFLISPANISGVRGRLILREQARFELALRLRETGAPLAEIFSFISGLYFRGKLAYARAFSSPPPDAPGILTITASHGLLAPEIPLSIETLREMSQVPIDAVDPRYRIPLERDAVELSKKIGADCEVILLGSIATTKYVEPLLDVFGSRLLFPIEFIGRGDMSRGALLLRSARDRSQLVYAPANQSIRQGSRHVKPRKVRRSSE